MEGEFNIVCEVVRLYGGYTGMGYFKSDKVLLPDLLNNKQWKPKLNRRSAGLKLNISPHLVLIQLSFR